MNCHCHHVAPFQQTHDKSNHCLMPSVRLQPLGSKSVDDDGERRWWRGWWRNVDDDGERSEAQNTIEESSASMHVNRTRRQPENYQPVEEHPDIVLLLLCQRVRKRRLQPRRDKRCGTKLFGIHVNHSASERTFYWIFLVLLVHLSPFHSGIAKNRAPKYIHEKN